MSRDAYLARLVDAATGPDTAMALRVQTVTPRSVRRDEPAATTPPRDAVQALREHAERVVLVGPPGSGKSTCLRALQRRLAKEARMDPSRPIPLLLALRYLSSRESVEEFVRGVLAGHGWPLAPAELTALIYRPGAVWWLLDGLNELQDPDAGQPALAALLARSSAPTVLTTREIGDDLNITRRLEMCPLTEDDRAAFVRGALPAEHAERLLREVRAGGRLRLWHLTERPFFLARLCEHYGDAGRLPADTSGVVMRAFCAGFVKETRGEQLTARRREELATRAGELAWWMIDRGQLAPTRADAADAIGPEAVDSLVRHHLLAGHGRVEFPHQLVTEYFAAEHLLRRHLAALLADRERLRRDFLRRRAWTEVFAFVLGLLADRSSIATILQEARAVDPMLAARLLGAVQDAELRRSSLAAWVDPAWPPWVELQFLAATGAEEALPRVREHLRSAAPGARVDAFDALMRIHGAAAFDPLADLVCDPHWYIRGRATRAVADLATEADGPALQRAFVALEQASRHDRDPLTRSRLHLDLVTTALLRLVPTGPELVAAAFATASHEEHRRELYHGMHDAPPAARLALVERLQGLADDPQHDWTGMLVRGLLTPDALASPGWPAVRGRLDPRWCSELAESMETGERFGIAAMLDLLEARYVAIDPLRRMHIGEALARRLGPADAPAIVAWVGREAAPIDGYGPQVTALAAVLAVAGADESAVLRRWASEGPTHLRHATGHAAARAGGPLGLELLAQVWEHADETTIVDHALETSVDAVVVAAVRVLWRRALPEDGWLFFLSHLFSARWKALAGVGELVTWLAAHLRDGWPAAPADVRLSLIAGIALGSSAEAATLLSAELARAPATSSSLYMHAQKVLEHVGLLASWPWFLAALSAAHPADMESRRWIRDALARRPADELWPAIVPALAHPHPNVRWLAVRLLRGLLPLREAVAIPAAFEPTLRAWASVALHSEEDDDRAVARQIVLALRDPALLPAFIGSLAGSSQHYFYRDFVLDYPAPPGFWRDRLDDPDRDVRRWAWQVESAHIDASWTPRLVAVVETGDYRLLGIATEALVGLRAVEATAALWSLLERQRVKHEWTARNIAGALISLEGPHALDRLLRLPASSVYDEVCVSVARDVDPARRQEIVLERLRDDAAAARRRAIVMVCRFGIVAAAPVLLERFDREPSAELREQIRDALSDLRYTPAFPRLLAAWWHEPGPRSDHHAYGLLQLDSDALAAALLPRLMDGPSVRKLFARASPAAMATAELLWNHADEDGVGAYFLRLLEPPTPITVGQAVRLAHRLHHGSDRRWAIDRALATRIADHEWLASATLDELCALVEVSPRSELVALARECGARQDPAVAPILIRCAELATAEHARGEVFALLAARGGRAGLRALLRMAHRSSTAADALRAIAGHLSPPRRAGFLLRVVARAIRDDRPPHTAVAAGRGVAALEVLAETATVDIVPRLYALAQRIPDLVWSFSPLDAAAQIQQRTGHYRDVAPAPRPSALRPPPSIGWLHLSGLHVGCGEHEWLWPGVREKFFADLARMHERSGPWHLVFLAGDATADGARASFERLDRHLDELWVHLRRLGSEPALIPVPGNHDHPRLAAREPVHHLIRPDDPELRRELFVGDSPGLAAVRDALAPYTEWAARSRLVARMTPGLVPGDLAVTHASTGLSLGILGFNTAYPLLGRDDAPPWLDVRQFHAVAGGDGPRWCAAHHLCVVLSHHAVGQFAPAARAEVLDDIDVPGRFAVWLSGHAPEARGHEAAHGGAQVRRALQGSSLFGRHLRSDGSVESRHGYSAGRFTLAADRITARIFPRRLERKQAGHAALDADLSFELADEAFAWDFGRPGPIRR